MDPDSIDIRALGLDDLDAYVAHMDRHSAESGRGDDPIFMPWDEAKPFDLDAFRARRAAGWKAELDTTEWTRAFGAWCADRLVGHAELSSPGIPAARHRASLGMGLERPFRGHGFGRALLESAIDWARGTGFLDWIDLGVFAENVPARALYTSFGFEEVGATKDLFRVHGKRIEDISMTLFIG